MELGAAPCYLAAMSEITALLIVRNEEEALPGCLDSLAGVVPRLVVVDTGSTDGTGPLLSAEILRSRFASVRRDVIPFLDFAHARNRALDLVETEWVLWIDADERLSPALRNELAADSIDDADAWSIPFRNHVLGRAMTCRELAGQRHLRLFRTDGARFGGAVHEGVMLPDGARVGELDGVMEHHTMRSWLGYMGKVDRYTALEAREGSRGRAAWHILVALPATFWRQWVRRGCMKDGPEGFVWALTSGIGAVLRDWRRLTR